MQQYPNESTSARLAPSTDFANANWQAIFHSESLRWPLRHTGPSPLKLHAPLLFWLTVHLEPRVCVTLGAQGSLSHLAICQAVRQLGLVTRCFAIAGTETALQAAVRDQHDRLYGSFSKLLPASCDEDGLQHFRCGAIDWLQVDGEAELEQLRSSWRSWRRRLSSQSILTIHGVKAALATPAGPWISRLQNCHPWVEFPHGEGLLLLAVGERRDRALEPLFAAGQDPQERSGLQSRFARLGMVCAGLAPRRNSSSDLLPA
jgi:hypothetical protein